MKTILVFGGIAIALVVGGVWLTSAQQESDPDVISRNGLHWHPTLEIYVRGEKIEISQNIGVGPQYVAMPTYDASMQMTAVHTHEDMPAIHLEFPGLVQEK